MNYIDKKAANIGLNSENFSSHNGIWYEMYQFIVPVETNKTVISLRFVNKPD